MVGISWDASRGLLGDSFEASWESFWGLLGPLLGLLGPLGASWGLLGASWGLLEASWGGRLGFTVPVPPLGPLLRPSWGPLGLSWAPLGQSWGPLGPARWSLGDVVGRVGAVLGASWAGLNAVKAERSHMPQIYVFLREWGSFCILALSGEAAWKRRRPYWRLLWPSLGPFGSHLGQFWGRLGLSGSHLQPYEGPEAQNAVFPLVFVGFWARGGPP